MDLMSLLGLEQVRLGLSGHYNGSAECPLYLRKRTLPQAITLRRTNRHGLAATISCSMPQLKITLIAANVWLARDGDSRIIMKFQ